MDERPPYRMIRDALESGRVIPFLGAGASLVGRPAKAEWKAACGFLPRGAELAKELGRAAQFPGEPTDLLAVAQYCDEAAGRDLLKQQLHAIFASAEYPLGSLHRYLASIDAPLIVVTTNYDDLLERAFDDVPHHLVVHATDPKYGEQILWQPPGESRLEPISPNRLAIDVDRETVIYKMHGTAVVDGELPVEESGQYVITEDDYVNFLTRLTKRKALPVGFAKPFERRNFLFLGYALRDWNLRVIMKQVHTKARQLQKIRSWAIDEKPSPLEQAFWLSRGVKIYRESIDVFVERLSAA
jgi:hypothetical protein